MKGISLILGSLLLLGTGYTREGSNQNAEEASQAVKIIFDTDLSGDWDDVGATATLHGLADLGEAEILGMCVSAGGYAAQWAPRCLDAFNTYYGRPDIPIGVVKDIGSTESVYIREIAENWPHDLTSEEVWDATELYRKILSGQPDTSVVIVTVGYLSNMEDLLQSGPDHYSDLDGTDLVNKKVKRWVCMGGKFPEGSESNLYSEPAASKYAIENWPRPILFSGIEIGNAIRSGQTLVRTSADNPIRRAYEICCGYVGGHHNSWDQTAVLAAVRNPLQYWDVETSGHMEITDDRASNAWRASPDKDHNYLKLKGEEEEVELVINDLMADVPFPWSDKNKLVANYKFNELATDIAPDASGNGNTGVFVGNHSWVEGRSGQAASFGEGSKFMYIENNDSFFFRRSGFSLAFWFYYPESVPEERQILVKRNLYYNEYLGVYMNGSDHTMGFQVKWDSVPGHTAILPDTWHHVTVTMDHEKARIYLDGKLEGEQTINIKKLYFPGSSFRIGANVDGEKSTETYMDDFLIFNEALSESDIAGLLK